jgi:hypothetical protein
MVRLDGPISMVSNNQFIKFLGSSLGVNRMWTERIDHALKSGCVEFFNVCSKRAILEKKIQV